MAACRKPSSRFFTTAVLFEGGLGAVAVCLAGWLDVPLLATIWSRASQGREAAAAVALGILAAAPMFAGLIALDRWAIGPIRELKNILDAYLVPIFSCMTTGELLVISLIAGVGEEMLFRGFLQTCLATWIGEPYGLILALVVASLTFGACHWLTTTYAALATLVGLYLGVVFYGSGNLLVPVVAHAVYDFAALMYLVKSQRALPDASEPSQVQE